MKTLPRDSEGRDRCPMCLAGHIKPAIVASRNLGRRSTIAATKTAKRFLRLLNQG